MCLLIEYIYSIHTGISKKIIKTKNFYFYRITNQIYINSVQSLKFVIDRDDVAQYYLFDVKHVYFKYFNTVK